MFTIKTYTDTFFCSADQGNNVNIHFVHNVVEMRQNIPVCPDVKTRKDPKTSKKAHGVISIRLQTAL